MKIKIYIILIISIIYSNGAKAQNRNIYLVPGAGGDATMFNIYKEYLNNQFSGRATATTLGFNQTQTVTEIGTALSNGMTNNNQNIAIGQSMGGLLVRGIDNVAPNTKFGGLITMGTPNKGGTIFNNNMQAAKDILNNGANEILDIGVTAVHWVPVFGWFIFFNGYANLLRTDILSCANNILESEINQKVPISLRQNLQENSTIIQNLNNNNSSTFKIGVYGVENSPVHWRLLSNYLYNNPWNMNLNQVNDVRVVNDVNNIRTEIVSWRNSLGSWYCDWWAWVIASPVCLYIELALNSVRSEMQDLINWTDNSEAQWHQVIGAGGFYTEKRYITSLKPEYQQAINDLYDLLYQSCDGVSLGIKDIGKIETNIGGVSDACQQEWYNLFAQIRDIENDPYSYQEVLTDVRLPINYQSDG
ncbi:MAG: hypothetical protein ORN58_03725, partial [Sediminibacterium sp.]|nr:hypothetical protein [Sediminibacterium sp.]